MLVDSHCHLDYLDAPPEESIARAKAAGVAHMLCVGADPVHFDRVLAVVQGAEGVDGSVGIHPLAVTAERASWDAVVARASAPGVVALGETGLDYADPAAPDRALQGERFARHLALGAELGLPVIIHTREAREDTLAQLRAAGPRPEAGVLHCFTESWEMAEEAIALGYYVSFSGIVTFKNAAALREVAAKVPGHRLLVETDAPWLAPVPHRGRQNEPALLPHTAAVLAQCRGVSPEILARQTTENYRRLFARTTLTA